MKTEYKIVLVMPVGPKCTPEFIEDSLKSFIFYASCTYKIILADDSRKGTGRTVQARMPEVDVVEMPGPMGKLGGLYVTLSRAFRYALRHYRFQAVLRMDSDALIIGKAPESEALDLFERDPQIGIAGQYPFDYDGKPWDISWPRKQLLQYMSLRWRPRHKTFPRLFLRRHYKRALRNNYTVGESVFGGAYFVSEICLRVLEGAGLLPLYPLKYIDLEEDHLFSLLVRSAGFALGDLSSRRLPMGCAWKGLPAPPEELYAEGKKIIHSTRYWGDMQESEIRLFFSRKRIPPPGAIGGLSREGLKQRG
jgi:hypothetical protein